jgi:hypothetical protein
MARPYSNDLRKRDSEGHRLGMKPAGRPRLSMSLPHSPARPSDGIMFWVAGRGNDWFVLNRKDARTPPLSKV